MKLVVASLFVILALLTFSFPLNNAIPTATASNSAPTLATAESFGLLASTITNANPTTVTGNVGSGAGGQTAPIGTVTGANHFNDQIYTDANADLLIAITDAQAQTCTETNAAAALLIGTYNPGVYCIGGAAALAGELTLNGSGLYIFDITGALATAAASSVQLTNGAASDDIFWVVTGATTLGAGTNFAGTIMSNAAVTIGAGSTVNGCVLTTGPATIATSTITCTTPANPLFPIITLTGADPQIIEVGGLYNELGATASDNLNVDITFLIVTDSTAVDTATVGSYFVTYDVDDTNGNSATQVIRVVNVVDSTGINLQSAETFAILATTITNANPTIIYGDVGSGPAGQVTAFAEVHSHIYLNDLIYYEANTDLISAIADGRSRACDTLNPGAVDLTLLTYTPGVHCIGGAADIPVGTLTLDGPEVYIFKITGALNTISSTSVVLTGGATSDKIFWVMTGASTLGTDSTFVGTILSDAAITIGTGAVIDGRALTIGPLTIATSTVTVP